MRCDAAAVAQVAGFLHFGVLDVSDLGALIPSSVEALMDALPEMGFASHGRLSH
jgi:hypothetical protein